jgi:hypothetical protein
MNTRVSVEVTDFAGALGTELANERKSMEANEPSASS